MAANYNEPAGIYREKGTQKKKESSEHDTVLVENIGNGKCTSSKTENDQRENGRLYSTRSDLLLDIPSGRSCHIEKPLTGRHGHRVNFGFSPFYQLII